MNFSANSDCLTSTVYIV